MGDRPRERRSAVADLEPRDVAVVHARLLDWYAACGRDLPWRRTRDPYAILVAEVMLQQTQVERVIPMWYAWLERFPTIHALARASRADAIRAWQGLGYNLRAVRLHAIACQVVAEHAGVLPRSVAGLLSLKGVGRYTAGAVACFAYAQPVAMVDTNVRRVLSRVFRVDPGAVEDIADAVVPPGAAYAWSQALMDLGATVCRAKLPMCLLCPLVASCGGPRVDVRAKKSRPAGEFRGSERYYRGRVVAFLARIPHGDGISIGDLATQTAPFAERARQMALIAQLASEGLLVIDAEQQVRLPD
ncbi:MAG TPA: A/G-specific adenine glycosylase [Chloroflexota bacterium]|nr:A/G-specific adenine glycosylase [Chloroflexota bacterium]